MRSRDVAAALLTSMPAAASNFCIANFPQRNFGLKQDVELERRAFGFWDADMEIELNGRREVHKPAVAVVLVYSSPLSGKCGDSSGRFGKCNL